MIERIPFKNITIPSYQLNDEVEEIYRRKNYSRDSERIYHFN